MKRLSFRRLAVLAALVPLASCATLQGAPKQQAHLDPAAKPKIDALVQEVVDNGNTPGAVLLIGIDDKVVMRKVYGNRMTEPSVEPMTFDTLFDLASLTKATTTASAVMLLVQDGKIALDDPVSKYVPEFAATDKPEITIKQLLIHESGLPAYTNATTVEEMYGPRTNPDGLIKRIAELDRKAAPGEEYIYSCLNYLTLARVVQNVTGENMNDFLRRRMWDPLKMKDTTFFPNEAQTARTAPTIYADTKLRRGAVHDPLAYYSSCDAYASGNAGAFSTVSDMSRYARMILDGGQLDGVRIFKPEIWTLITTNQAPEGLEPRSCGWGVWTSHAYATSLNQSPETACLGHTGYTGTILWMDKLSKAYVILFTNCVYPDDKKENKDAVIAARRKVISTVIDNLDIYKDVREGEEEETGQTAQ